MAMAKKCDICGKFYETYNIKHNENKTSGLMFLNVDEYRKYFSNTVIDCCPECMKSIKNHIDLLRNGGLEGKSSAIQ